MKLIGIITKGMYYNQNPKFISHTDLQMYKIPTDTMCALDIGRFIYLNEETGELKLESYKNKSIREAKTYIYEKQEDRPIINDTSYVSH